MQGRLWLAEDALNNLTATVYDDDGRPVETWVGTDATAATADDPSGGSAGASGGNNMVQVAGNVYDSYGEMDQSMRLQPNLTSLSTFSTSGGDALATDYDDQYIISGGGGNGA